MYSVKEGQVAHQVHVGLPSVTYEEGHDRKDFFGKSAPTGWTRFEGKLRPHLFDLNLLLPTDQTDPQGAPAAILSNVQIRISVSRRNLPESADYSILPRASTYRIATNSEDNFFLLIESKSKFDPPENRFLGQHAFYDPSIVTIPDPARGTLIGPEWEQAFYPFHPIEQMRWESDVFAWKIKLRDIRPIMNHRAHLPPSAQTTFVTEGTVLCSFLPHPLEEDPEAMCVRYFHRNTEYDEDFVSKDNIKPVMATLHPRRIQANKTRTDEYAVMLDSLNPIQLLPAGEAVECADYWAHWQTGAKSK